MKNDLSRRKLLGGAGILSGALILERVARAAEAEGAAPKEEDGDAQLVLKLSDNPELGKVGGWKIFELEGERVIVANTESGLIARSAICRHKNCTVEYRLADKQFVCPCHNSRFDESGKVLRGPAKVGLESYSAEAALVVSKPEVEVAPVKG